MNKNSNKPQTEPCTIHGVMWRILLMVAMACVAGIIGIITPNEYDVGVMFVIGWWCCLVWNKVFP